MRTIIIRSLSFFSLTVFLFACGGSNSSSESTVTSNENQDIITPVIPAPPEDTDSTTITSVEQSAHDFTSDHFSGSDNCAQCHDGLSDDMGEDLSIVTAWQTTMMANSARDPFWKAKVASEVVRNPEHGKTIEGKCARCHMPMAHVEATFKDEAITLFEDGFLSPDNPYFNQAAEGVSCTVCHQIENTAGFGTEAATSGKFVIADNTADPKLYGPFSNPIQGPMLNSTGYTPVESQHISDSALCGSCHDVKTPIIDTSGNLTANEFPEQMIYSEWKNSDFAKPGSEESCQSCHMPLASGKTKIASRPSFVEARDHFSKHQFVGANTVMLDILQNNSTTLGLPVNDFSNTINLTKETLRSSADIAIENLQQENQQLSFNVHLKNKTGHKFPSGFPSRRAWLHIQVTNTDGDLVFESGAINHLGQISGVDSDNDNDTTNSTNTEYEKHHDLITSADQVQVYESIMVNTDNSVNYTLLNSAGYIKDNRLLAKGMDKSHIPVDIGAKGNAIDDENFDAAEDVVTYQLQNIPTGSYIVKATLNYQSISYRFATDLFKDKSAHSLVNDFKLMYDNARFRHEEVISVEANL
ncbi:multiheme c-type cytochrome [Cocleimonas sp. KMM 6892]|uniref:multiheme c-type cytochrome n=1 Tax=unclassified Cocleimonas TaxID=2639732 RepID=UPI002DBF69A1|nr:MULTISPECIES: multiheme c-type cytochrome [unclassified Cocleimonas]MEB8432044.1 multiheme c-type cytochrome [Cocleimonas sp. KMM 6892]MEC4714870.1 multiheme c-type cytochrome [Cocleimonas sp. KMM 6895]MEC4744316.1 multiheme c-type cytochrome [Cocleimonas sp. KMM 6896]